MSTRAHDAGLHDSDPNRPPNPRFGVLAAFALTWLAASFASSVVLVISGEAGDGVSIPVLGASLLAGWAVFAAGVWWSSRALGTGDPVEDYALRVRPFDLVGVPLGVVAQLGLVPLIYLPLRALWPDTFDTEALRETADDLVDRADGGLIVLLFVLVVVGAPIVEEVVYRGMLQRPLLDRFPPAPVIVGVAALFALIHFRPVEYPGLFVAGLVFGVCAWWTGRVGTAVAAHVAFNATGLAFAL